jgi:iron complex outermembrane receptor protein
LRIVRALVLSVLSFSASGPTALSAQEPTPAASDQPAAASASSGPIEEITITAEKRETNLQDTPIAITAISSETIDNLQIEGFGDVQMLAPSLTYGEISDMALISVRGIGVDVTNMSAEPAVALYADGVYRGGITSSSQLLFDVERIEVLRGPQGTLYGRNSTGGALNVLSKLPGEELRVEATGLFGSFHRKKWSLAADVPLVPDLLSVRGAFEYDTRDHWGESQINNIRIGNRRARNAKLAAVLTPSDSVEFVLRGDWARAEAGGPPYIFTHEQPVAPGSPSPSNPLGFLAGPGICDPLLTCAQVFGWPVPAPGVFSSDPQHPIIDEGATFDRESWGVNGTLTWDISDSLHLKSVTSYFDVFQESFQDENDGTSSDFLSDHFVQTNREWSQEINLGGTAFDEKLDWIVGAFYYDSEIGQAYNFHLAAMQTFFEALYALVVPIHPSCVPILPSGCLANFNTHLDGTRDPVPWLDFILNQDLKSYAFFGQGTYQVTDRLRGTFGLRWSKDRKDWFHSLVNNIGGVAPPGGELPGQCRGNRVSDEYGELTGKAGVDFDVNEQTLAYATISRGFKSGGHNAGGCLDLFDPETVLAYELGAKTTVLGDRLRLNGAFFFNDFKNYQALQFTPNASIVENASNATTWGFELEWLAYLTDDFSIDGGATYMQAKFDKYFANDPLNPTVGLNPCPDTTFLICKDNQGNTLPRAPKFKSNLGVQYVLGIANAGDFTLRGDWAYIGDVYHDNFNNAFARQDAYHIVNLRLIWKAPETLLPGLTFEYFVENIADKDYVTIHAPSATNQGVVSMFGPPRTWGFQLRYEWGKE